MEIINKKLEVIFDDAQQASFINELERQKYIVQRLSIAYTELEKEKNQWRELAIKIQK